MREAQPSFPRLAGVDRFVVQMHGETRGRVSVAAAASEACHEWTSLRHGLAAAPLWLAHPRPYLLHSAWVGDIRAALMAGSSPAMAPMTSAEASPPAQASAGMTVVQCLVWA